MPQISNLRSRAEDGDNLKVRSKRLRVWPLALNLIQAECLKERGARRMRLSRGYSQTDILVSLPERAAGHRANMFIANLS